MTTERMGVPFSNQADTVSMIELLRPGRERSGCLVGWLAVLERERPERMDWPSASSLSWTGRDAGRMDGDCAPLVGNGEKVDAGRAPGDGKGCELVEDENAFELEDAMDGKAAAAPVAREGKVGDPAAAEVELSGWISRVCCWKDGSSATGSLKLWALGL